MKSSYLPHEYFKKHKFNKGSFKYLCVYVGVWGSHWEGLSMYLFFLEGSGYVWVLPSALCPGVPGAAQARLLQKYLPN